MNKPINENDQISNSALQALTHGVPIVKTEFWKAFIESARQNTKTLPNIEDFTPPLTEEYINKNDPNTLKVNLSRQRLFQGKTFVFMSPKQASYFSAVIESAGGKLTRADNTICDRKNWLKKNFIVVRYASETHSQRTQAIDDQYKFLEMNGRRAVSQDEIALAIIHCSVEQYCNPDYNFIKKFEVESNAMDSNGVALAPESVPLSHTSNEQPPSMDIFVPETDQLAEDKNVESEGSQLNFVVETEPFKVPAIDNSQPKEKRKLRSSDNDVIDAPNPSKRSRVDDASRLNTKNSPTTSHDKNAEEGENFESQQSFDVSGFISTRSRNRNLSQNTKTSSPKPETVEAKRKRGCLFDDDEGISLGFAKKKKQSKIVEHFDAQDDDVDGGTFKFSQSRQKSQKTKTENANKQKTIGSLVAQQRRNDDNDKLLSHVKKIPFKNEGWLSHSTVVKRELLTESEQNDDQSVVDSSDLDSSIKIKKENVEDSELIDVKERMKWLNEMQNGFVNKEINVSFVRLNVSNRSSNDAPTSFGQPNFKKFVKKLNYVPQKEIISTTKGSIVDISWQ